VRGAPWRSPRDPLSPPRCYFVATILCRSVIPLG
jgi:hypothetical protein